MNIIELEDVWKVYNVGEVEVPALRGLSLKVEHGEFLAIMGPSGSGKSTAMNMVGCLDIPTKGRVLLEGQDIANLNEMELQKKKYGISQKNFCSLSGFQIALIITLHSFRAVRARE